MTIKRILFFSFICLLPLFSIGQQANTFKIFFEKVYLQSDKSYYVAGEDIWFKAYLVNAQTGMRINTSNVLYVELISPSAKILSRLVLRVENGLGEGDFTLPANAVAGKYRIRAYTNWMQNFGDLFLFDKEIQVAAIPAVKENQDVRNKPVVVTSQEERASGGGVVRFFPEGGYLVTGLLSRLAFKATDKFGAGIAVTGRIVNSKGDSVASFKAGNTGMGSMDFMPQPAESYKAIGKLADKESFEVAIKDILSDGYVLRLLQNNGKVLVNIKTTTASGPANSKLMLIIRNVGKKVFADSSVSIDAGHADITVSETLLPRGVNIATLYDENKKPVAERLFFVDKTAAAALTITPGSSSYTSLGKATVQMTVADGQGKPVQARMSLSVTDGGNVPSANSNIVSYLALESEIKGEIENPARYFDRNNPLRNDELNLLLLTQGWRQFLWRRLADTSLVIRFMPEPGITLSGKVKKQMGGKGLEGMNVTLYAQESKGDKLFMTTTNADGRYFLDGLPLYGQQEVRLSARNSKTLKKEGEILLDSLYGKPYPLNGKMQYMLDTSELTHRFWSLAPGRSKIMQEEKINGEGMLENVTVTGRRKLPQLVEEPGTKFGADSLFIIGPQDATYKTVENFVLQRYPGAFSNADQDGFFFYGDGGKRIRPRWVVDGREDRSGNGNSMDVDPETGRNAGAFDRIDYFNIPINRVKSVGVTPVITQFNKQVMIITLSLLPGALDAGDLSILNTVINGYYEARKYYEPEFVDAAGKTVKKDMRSTIFWVPSLQTDENGKAIVSFTNSVSGVVEVHVNGVTDEGVPVTATIRYQVK